MNVAFQAFQNSIPGITLDLTTLVIFLVFMGCLFMGIDYLREMFCATETDLRHREKIAAKKRADECDSRIKSKALERQAKAGRGKDKLEME